MSEPIPAEVMEEARKLLREGNCVACIDDIYCCCFDPLCEALLAAEKRGEQRATIRGELAVGNTLEEMRANVSPDLANLGDTVLAWVNEGDLIMSKMLASAIRSPT